MSTVPYSTQSVTYCDVTLTAHEHSGLQHSERDLCCDVTVTAHEHGALQHPERDLL